MPGQTDGQGRRCEFSGGRTLQVMFFSRKGRGDGTKVSCSGEKEDCFKYFLFSPLPGEMIQFDQYFSNGLKPPTRR